MSKGKLSNLAGAAETLLLVCGLVFAQGVACAQEQKANPAPVQTGGSEPAQEKSSEDGAHQSIKIHGHWTIEVHNPDGTIVTHREFENAYVPSALLSQALDGTGDTLFTWEVFLGGSPAPCPDYCVIVPPSYGPNEFLNPNSANLVVAAQSGTLVFSGSVTASVSASINLVQTRYYQFDKGPQLPFTQANLLPNSSTPPISVLAGQTIAVTVVISFS